MADVNFLEYGSNALRVQNSFFDLVSFATANGYFIGFLIVIIIIIALVLVVFIYGASRLKRAFK